MFPKIELRSDKSTYTKKEVQEMIDELNFSCASLLAVQTKLYRFAKIISYLSLSVCLLLLMKEVFLR